MLITDDAGRQIVIENKIYAGEQENQLGRYQAFAPNATLIFLTLNGDEPTGTDLKSLPNLKCVSYRSHILSWLIECRKEAAGAPCVRETITQYIHLIQELTQQNTSTRMNQELIKAVLETEESFLAYVALRNADSDVRSGIIASFNEKLCGIAKELGLDLEQSLGDKGQKYDNFWFSSPALKAQGLRIEFEFGKSEYRDFSFGFSYVDQDRGSAVSESVQKLFKAEFGSSESDKAWAASLWWEQHLNWTDATFASIKFGSFSEDIKKVLGRLEKIANQACVAT